MKIVKQFDDFEYFDLTIEGPNDPVKDRWTWGLGEDGKIYCQSTQYEKGKWYVVRSIYPSLKMMKRIVEEFGHLLSFV